MPGADAARGEVWEAGVRRGAVARQGAVVDSAVDSVGTAADGVVDEVDSVRAEGRREEGVRPGVEVVTDRCASFSRIPFLFACTSSSARSRGTAFRVMSRQTRCV